MVNQKLIFVSVLLTGAISLQGCALPTGEDMGQSLRKGLAGQQIANGAQSLENNAYQMQKSMNSFYGAIPPPPPLQPAIAPDKSVVPPAE